MKQKALRLINQFLDPFQAKIVRKNDERFSMSDAIKRIDRHQLKISTVVDIGASDGKWSLMAMEILPSCRFVAIEPLQERQIALESMKKHHSKFDYITCVAGGSDQRKVILNVSSDLDGSTVNGLGGESRSVQERTIDSIVQEKSLTAPFLLKFDTHGYELPILEGAKSTLKETSVIIMEVYNFRFVDHVLRFHEMCHYMEDMGFRCYDMADPMLRERDNALWQMDLFFCRHDAPIFSSESYQ